MAPNVVFIGIEGSVVKMDVQIKCMLECFVLDMEEKNDVCKTDVPITLVEVDSVCTMEGMQLNDTVVKKDVNDKLMRGSCVCKFNFVSRSFAP